MIWKQISDSSIQTEDGAFIVTRFGMGATVAFQAITMRNGTRSIHIERGIPKEDDRARRAAVRRCQQACEATLG